MDYIRKLPLLMAVTGGLIVGLAGYAHKVPDKENMIKMLIVMIIFYIVGYWMRDTTISIVDSSKKKAKEKENEIIRFEKEKRKKESDSNREAAKNKGLTLDLTADGELSFNNDEEDFDALPVADFIKKELNQ